MIEKGRQYTFLENVTTVYFKRYGLVYGKKSFRSVPAQACASSHQCPISGWFSQAVAHTFTQLRNIPAPSAGFLTSFKMTGATSYHFSVLLTTRY
jgi:hypothetical protein